MVLLALCGPPMKLGVNLTKAHDKCEICHQRRRDATIVRQTRSDPERSKRALDQTCF
jgi:hypothetical protein